MNDKKYDVFISYASQDKEWVSKFTHALDEGGFTTWFDDTKIHPGDDLLSKLETALRETKALVMVLSDNSIDNPTVFFEYGAALGGNKRIIPVIIKDMDESKIPPSIRTIKALRENTPETAGKRIAELLMKATEDSI